jgi:hypothetical protein
MNAGLILKTIRNRLLTAPVYAAPDFLRGKSAVLAGRYRNGGSTPYRGPRVRIW